MNHKQPTCFTVSPFAVFAVQMLFKAEARGSEKACQSVRWSNVPVRSPAYSHHESHILHLHYCGSSADRTVKHELPPSILNGQVRTKSENYQTIFRKLLSVLFWLTIGHSGSL